VCNSAQTEKPISSAHPLQKGTSGTCYPIAHFVNYANFSRSHQNFLASLTKVVEPKFYHEPVQNPLWRTAIAEEIKALEANRTWVIVDLPLGINPISCKWVYRVKCNSEGSIQ